MIAKVIGIVFLILVVSFVIGFITTGGDLITYKFWAPKQANAERVVFENTQGYVQGKVEYITRLRYNYETATGSQKDALRMLILDEASNVDNSKLPADLQVFILRLKGQL